MSFSVKTGRRGFLAALALVFAALPQTSTAAEDFKRQASSEVWVRTELFFGTNMAGGEVSDADFTSFVDNEVTTRFPDGLTHLVGQGQFKGESGILVREKSHLLIILYPPQMRDANSKIQALRDAYKKRFAQESVLRVDSYALVSF